VSKIRTVVISDVWVVNFQDSLSTFMKRVEDGRVDDNYAGKISVAGTVDDKATAIEVILGKNDIGKVGQMIEMIGTLRDNRGGRVSLLINDLHVCDHVSDVELCFDYDE